VVAGTTRTVEAYGAGRLQRGEWWLPPGAAARTGRLPTVVLVHGGYWQPGYDRSLEDAVAADLAGRGYLVWNLDYAAGDVPWPATLLDVAAGHDHLTRGRYADRVDPARTAVVGHSAGGHLALWLASRSRLPAGAPGAAPVAPPPALAVGQAPVAALVRAAAEGLGDGAAVDLLDGTPEDAPERYALADPVALAPAGVPTLLLHSLEDALVPITQSQAYVAAAGPTARLVQVRGDHFAHLDPRSPALQELRGALAEALG
jgi:acetyl esterase/lipase